MEHLDWPAAPLESPTSHSSAGAIWYMPSAHRRLWSDAIHGIGHIYHISQTLHTLLRTEDGGDISRRFWRHGSINAVESEALVWPARENSLLHTPCSILHTPYCTC